MHWFQSPFTGKGVSLPVNKVLINAACWVFAGAWSLIHAGGGRISQVLIEVITFPKMPLPAEGEIWTNTSALGAGVTQTHLPSEPLSWCIKRKERAEAKRSPCIGLASVFCAWLGEELSSCSSAPALQRRAECPFQQSPATAARQHSCCSTSKSLLSHSHVKCKSTFLCKLMGFYFFQAKGSTIYIKNNSFLHGGKKPALVFRGKKSLHYSKNRTIVKHFYHLMWLTGTNSSCSK